MKKLNLSKRAIGAAVIAALLMAPAAGFAATRYDGGRDGYSPAMHGAAPAMRAYAAAGRLTARGQGDAARACMHSPGSQNFEPCFGR